MMPHPLRSNLLGHGPVLLVGLVVAVVMAGCGTAARLPPPLQVPAPAFPDQGTPPLLVDAAWLLARPTGSVRVLDASSPAAYRAGHIPGALHAWWQDTMDPNGAVYGTVLKPDMNAPDPQALRRAYLRLLGVTPDRPVVVYDDADGRWAARIVWTLRFLGHPEAALLHGGLAAWLGAGGSTETRTATAPAVPDQTVTPRTGYYLVRDEVRARRADPRTMLLDVRTASEQADTFDGTVPPGSIPGSVSVPWNQLVERPAGTLRPADELRALFVSAGITTDRAVILYGNFGTDTGLTWLVLKLLGYPEVLVYDGGWAEWSRTAGTGA